MISLYRNKNNVVGYSRQIITCESEKKKKKKRRERQTTLVSIARENIVALVRFSSLRTTAN